MANATKIEISTLSLLKVVGIFLILWFLYVIRWVVAILFVAVILAAAVGPLVNWLVKKKIPRLISVLIIYIILLAVVSLLIVLFLPPITAQIHNLAVDFPTYWNKISAGISTLEGYSQQYGLASNIQEALQQLGFTLSQARQGVLSTLASIFGGFFSFLVVLVITFYLLIEENAIKRTLRFLVPAKYQPYLTRLLLKMQDKIGRWLRGQIFLSLIIGLLVYLGLNVFGLFNPIFAKYALILALLAFFLEFVPYLGPVLAAIPTIFIGLTQSLAWVAVVLLFYIIMQWIENNLIVPQVMKKAVGLNPIIVIVALMIGAKIAGVVGIILALPLVAALSVLIEEIFQEIERRELETD